MLFWRLPAGKVYWYIPACEVAALKPEKFPVEEYPE
jgi:hypothetical protein